MTIVKQKRKTNCESNSDTKRKLGRLCETFTIGKRIYNTLMICGRSVDGGSAQIFVECGKCGDSIALLPKEKVFNRNELIDSIPDKTVASIFKKFGWSVKDFGSNKTRCPKHKSP